MTAPCVIDAGTVVEDFSTLSSWSKDSQIGTLGAHWRCLDDASKVGVKAYHAFSASPTTGYLWRTDKSFSLSDMEWVRLDFEMALTADMYQLASSLTLEFSSTTDFSKTMAFTTTAITPQTSGPLRLLIKKTEFTATGGESWSNTMVAIRIGIKMTSTSYGCSHGHHFYFDKIVKNPRTTSLIMIGFTPSYTYDSNIFMDALADNGLAGKAHGTMIDYQGIGLAGRNSFDQLLALENAGLVLYPSHTAWLLYAQTSSEHPVPPYPPQDLDYIDVNDSYGGNLFTAWHHREIHSRMRAIHEWYGLPFRGDVFMPHAGYYYGATGREFTATMGFRAYTQRADWTATSKGTIYQTLPAAANYMLGWNIATSTASHANVMSAIDEVCEGYGRYLWLQYGSFYSSEWTESDLRTELAYIKGKQDDGDLLVVTPYEFINQAMEPVPVTAHSVILGSLDLNDGVNFFVESTGFDVGTKRTTWDEVASYAATSNVQVNVQRNALIPVTIPMLVKGSSVSDLQANLNMLWAEVDKSSNTLTLDNGEEFTIVSSTRPEVIERDLFYQLNFSARFTLMMMRTP